MRRDMQNIPPRPTAAFTILELMVAVAIIIVLTIMTVPTFRSMQANLNASSAENTLSVVLNQARNLAMRGDLGDTAVIFLYEREKRLYSLLVASQRLEGLPEGYPNPPVNATRYDIFAPVEGTRQRNLPPGWEVRGLAYGATTDWYDHGFSNQQQKDVAWVFPESDFGFDTDTRQTFMIRFAAGSGAAITSNEQFRTPRALVYLQPDPPFSGLTNIDFDYIRKRCVQARPTPALALYSVDELVERVANAAVDEATGTLFGLGYDGDGSYVQPYEYFAADGVTYDEYEAIFHYLDENTDPIVFNRFTGMIMRNPPQ